MMELRIKRYDNDKGKPCLDTIGVGYGGDSSKVIIEEENDGYILCRVTGSMGWSGRGDTAYCHPLFIVFAKLEGERVKQTFGEEYTKDTKRDVYVRARVVFDGTLS